MNVAIMFNLKLNLLGAKIPQAIEFAQTRVARFAVYNFRTVVSTSADTLRSFREKY